MNRSISILSALFFLALVFAASGQEGAPPDYYTRYGPAVAAAKKSNKSLMIIFTGTKWIKICEAFERDILSQPEFWKPASEKYVFLNLDYPENNRLPAELAKEYQLLKDAYRVRGYPTVMVTDEKGLPFGMNGYQPLSASQYAAIMLAMAKGREVRDQAKARASKLEGVKRAEAMVEAIPDLPGTLTARYYREEMEDVIKNDPKNKTGKVETYQKLLADVKYANEMQRLAADVQYGKMIELTDQYIKEQKLEGEFKQKALFNKLDIQKKQKNTAGVVQTLLEVVTIDPNTQFGKRAQKMLERLRAQKIQEDLVK